MNLKLVKLENLSGEKASIYSLYDECEDKTLLDNFLQENIEFRDEVKDILSRLKTIGNNTGAKEYFFKKDEGVVGDAVWALYDKPERNLRLYCIRYAETIIILGGGGPKNVRALQDDEKLTRENKILRIVSKQIDERLRNKDLMFSDNLKEIFGDFLEFEI